MIYSMTAFARTQTQGEWGTLVCELRSINHRYLDISLHLPDVLRSLEMPIRERIRKFTKRGKIDCTLRYQPSASVSEVLFTVNSSLVQALCQASDSIATMLNNPASASPAEILRFPGVLEVKDADGSKLQAAVLAVLDDTLKELVLARGREGEELKKLFLTKMTAMEAELSKVRHRLPAVMTEAQQRLIKRFNEAKLELDSNRLEQEMLMFAQKIDVAEEIDRTETHIAEIRRILNQDELIGRRLDFLLQELNREANTLGSKSIDATLTHAAVEMKVLIEQVREQAQNVE